MKNPNLESKRWFEQAKYDLKTSQWNLKGNLFAPAGFWAQQSTGKAVKAAKAYLYLRGERFVIGHSVSELLEKCKNYDKDFKVLIPIGAFLDRFYIPTRYPNGLPGGVPAHAYRRKDANEAIKLAQEILDFINNELIQAQGMK